MEALAAPAAVEEAPPVAIMDLAPSAAHQHQHHHHHHHHHIEHQVTPISIPDPQPEPEPIRMELDQPDFDDDDDHFSDDDDLSDDGDSSAPMPQEHRDADTPNDDDEFKDDFEPNGPEFEANGQNDDLSSVSNVTLEPLRTTKQAVAQFAENNIPPSEVAMIHSTLYSLQQQQIIQLHLIQQLHQQLLRGYTPAIPTSMLPLPMTSLPAITSSATPMTPMTSSHPIAPIITTASATDFTMTSSSKPPFRSHLAELETMTNKPQMSSTEEEKAKAGELFFWKIAVLFRSYSTL